MNRNKAKILAALCLSASATIFSSPAAAQALDVDVPAKLWIVRPLQLYVDSPLQFGAVAPPAAAGTVRVTADAAATRTSPSGNVTLLPVSATFPVTSGRVRAEGELNAAVAFLLDWPATLDNAAAGSSLALAGTDSATPTPLLSTPAAGGLGSYSFYLGGTVTFAGGEPGGLYQNVINVTASYN